MAIPIAVTNFPMSAPDIRTFSAVPFNVALDGTASFDPDAGTITAYSWTLVYSPPGSSASLLNPTTATPTLQNVDVVGSYLVFLQVTDSGAENSEPVQRLAPDSAFALVAHKTQVEDFRIPASGERNWADVAYVLWTTAEAKLSLGGTWDTTHELIFTSGLSAHIRDDRAAASKGGLAGLLIDTTTGASHAGASYFGIQVSPGAQGGGGGETIGIVIDDMDQGIKVDDPIGGGGLSVGIGCEVGFSTDVTRFGYLMTSAFLGPSVPGSILAYRGFDASGSVGTVVLSGHDDNYLLPATAWGTSGALPPNTPNPRFSWMAQRLTTTQLHFDARSTSNQLMAAAGALRYYTNIGAGAIQSEQDIVLARVHRQDVAGVLGGQDFGLIWRESIVELGLAPPDPDIFPARTLIHRRPDAVEWSSLSAGVLRVATSDFVPTERPVLYTGTIAAVNPASNGISEVVITQTVPAGFTQHTGYEAKSMLTAEVEATTLVYDGPLVATTKLLTGPDRLEIRVRYLEPMAMFTGVIDFVTSVVGQGESEGGSIDVAALFGSVKTGAAHIVTVLITPFVEGGVVPPDNAFNFKLNALTFNGSDELTAFTFIVEMNDPLDVLPARVKAHFAILAPKTFLTTDAFDVRFQAVTRMLN